MSASEFALKHCGCTFRARETRERLSEQQREAGGEERRGGGGGEIVHHSFLLLRQPNVFSRQGKEEKTGVLCRKIRKNQLPPHAFV